MSILGKNYPDNRQKTPEHTRSAPFNATAAYDAVVIRSLHNIYQSKSIENRNIAKVATAGAIRAETVQAVSPALNPLWKAEVSTELTATEQDQTAYALERAEQIRRERNMEEYGNA